MTIASVLLEVLELLKGLLTELQTDWTPILEVVGVLAVARFVIALWQERNNRH
ncbi:hypothetical protein [Micromonospora rosaria]|uniref:hypothetical protein n=1 Tax=Micromonospora rosaria TaxID=47874 RepID=UPI0012FAB421|nr:hypothetical protein [Micromonospora rosaria]